MPQNQNHLLATALVLLATLAAPLPAAAKPKPPKWVGTWAASPCAPSFPTATPPPIRFSNQTLRERVHTTIGGEEIRLTLTNLFGHEPLTLGSIHVALSPQPGEIAPATDHLVTFHGQPSVIVPQGGVVFSDPIPLHLAPASDLSISLYLPHTVTEATTHYTALSSTFIADGDQTTAPTLSTADRSSSWFFLSGVAVAASPSASAIVTLGSSTTDGDHSTSGKNLRWPDDLFRRLLAAQPKSQQSVLNEGLSGNRILHNGVNRFAARFGESATVRFDRDVLAQPGVKFLILFEGGNDITHPGGTAPASETVTPAQLIDGLRQLALRAHQHGIKVIGGTITPFEGLTDNTYNAEREAMRMQVNDWILHTSDLDGAVDFAKAVADPTHPSRFLPAFDSGDHLHPNDAGYQAMADSIPLQLLK